MVMKEVDEDLAKERNNRILIEDLNEFDGSTEGKPDSLLMKKAMQPDKVENMANNDDFLNLKSDYDRNLKQCGEEVEKKDSGANQTGILNGEADSLNSKANRRRSLPSMDLKTTPRAAKSKPSSTANSTAASSSSKTMPRSSAPPKATSTTPTQTRKPTTPSTKANLSASDRSGKKMGPTAMSKSWTRGASQMVKPRPSSASNGKPRPKSCSPRKARANSNSNGGDDDVSPLLMGTKMVERVVNMRKLAPPKQENYASVDKPKKSSVENSGFGRSLSKKSLDMAIRHMDIGRSIS